MSGTKGTGTKGAITITQIIKKISMLMLRKTTGAYDMLFPYQPRTMRECKMTHAWLTRTGNRCDFKEGVLRDVGLNEIEVPLAYLSLYLREGKRS